MTSRIKIHKQPYHQNKSYCLPTLTRQIKRISNYELKQTIGVGGSAKVKRAVHIPTKEIVAVKIFSLRKMSEERLKLLKQQIQISKTLAHQNIAKIYEVHKDSSRLYLFMEYCPNGDLFEAVNQKGPLKSLEAIKIFKQIHSAVSYLHQNHICHRDIKLENILLDENNNAKLIDFGLSSFYDLHKIDGDKMLSTFCGSPSYLCPEMINKTPYDPQLLDVWCLGVTLYTMLTGKLPFYSSDDEKEQKKIKGIEYSQIGVLKLDLLIRGMLCGVKDRKRLREIQKNTLLKFEETKSHCMSIQQQKEAIDEDILKLIEQEQKISAEILRKSLKDFSLDENYALYYLYLNRERKQGNFSCYDFNSPSFLISRKKSMPLPHITNQHRKTRLFTIGVESLGKCQNTEGSLSSFKNKKTAFSRKILDIRRYKNSVQMNQIELLK